jgi:hypothetical protein
VKAMSNPSDVPQPQQPGAQPPASNVPPAGNEPPQGYQPPPQGYQAPGQAFPQPGQPYAQPAQGYGQPVYPSGAAPSNEPPAGLGYAAPPRNAFGLDFTNISQRLTNTQGVPQQLVTSYWLWIAAAGLGVIFGLISMFSFSGAFGGMMMGAGVGGFIFQLLFAALYVFIAIRLKEGARWARLVLSILGGLAVIGFLANLVFLNPSILGSAAAVAAAVMMWLPQSQEHFKG